MINAFWNWFDETPFWHWLAKNIIGKLTFRFCGYKQFSQKTLLDIEQVLINSTHDKDFIYAFVSCDRLTLSSILIRLVSKSQWSHAGILTYGDFISARAMHMQGRGLIYEPIPTLLKTVDDFVIVRIPVKDRQVCMNRVAFYNSQSHFIQYDYEQELVDDASPLEANDIYCSELVWLICKGQAKLNTSKVLGRVAFTPDDLYKSGDIVFEYKKGARLC